MGHEMRCRRMLLAAAAALSLGWAPAPVHLDFDGAWMSGLSPGCLGSAQDWESVREIGDARDGSIRSRGVENETCMLVSGAMVEDGAVSARLAAAGGPAGFALRCRDADHYLGVYVHLAAGIAEAKQWDGQRATELGAFAFDPKHEGLHELIATLQGPRLTVWLDGERILDALGVQEVRGGVGLLAAPLAIARFDDVTVTPWRRQVATLIRPATLPPGMVGSPYEARLDCLSLEERTAREECSFDTSSALPPGLRLERSGRLAGLPQAPSNREILLRVLRQGHPPLIQPARIRIQGALWPRFPLHVATRSRPVLAVLYTPDDIGQTVTLKKLGYPDRLLFRLHQDHPRLRVSIMSCPANRYAGETTLLDSPEAMETWRSLALDANFAWVELGGHGYTHSPEGDANLDHPEFSATATGCNLDHSKMGEPSYCRRRMSLARAAYRAAGISDDRVAVMRFPGVVDSPEALRAAAQAGFVAILGSRHLDEPGREWWIPGAGGEEMLEIQSTNLLRSLILSPDLEAGLAEGRIKPSDASRSPELLAAVERARRYVEGVVSEGGILNLFNHYWETFIEITGMMPRYLILDAMLRDIDATYGARVWYPGARDLALWLEARRYAELSWREGKDGLHVRVEPPSRWKRLGLSGLEQASLLVRLPRRYGMVSGIRIREEGARPRLLDPSLYWLEPEGGLAVSFPLRGRVELLIAGAKARQSGPIRASPCQAAVIP